MTNNHVYQIVDWGTVHYWYVQHAVGLLRSRLQSKLLIESAARLIHMTLTINIQYKDVIPKGLHDIVGH